MAGDWMQIDLDLPDTPEVMKICADTGMDTHSVVGRLVAVWRWIERMAVDGQIRHATPAVVASVASADQRFVESLVSVEWMAFDETGALIPGWEKRFSKAAKQRMVDAKRKQASRRHDLCPESDGHKPDARPEITGTKEEKKKEKKKTPKKGDTPQPPVFVLPPSIRTEVMEVAVTEWLTYKAERREKYTPTGLKKFLTGLASAVALHGESTIIAKFDKAMGQGWKGWDHADSRGSPTGSKATTRDGSEILSLRDC